MRLPVWAAAIAVLFFIGNSLFAASNFAEEDTLEPLDGVEAIDSFGDERPDISNAVSVIEDEVSEAEVAAADQGKSSYLVKRVSQRADARVHSRTRR